MCLYKSLEADSVSARALVPHVWPLQACLSLLELLASVRTALSLSLRAPLPSRLANEVSGLTFPLTCSTWGSLAIGLLSAGAPNKPIKANDKEPN